MNICPNKNHPDWIKLVSNVGEDQAYIEYMLNGFDIPISEVINLIPSPINEVNKIAERLKEKTGIEYETISKEAASKLLKTNQLPNGFFKGGKVYLVEGLANENTTLHEFSHPFVSAIKKSNEKLYKALSDEIIKEDSTLRRVTKLYPELSKEDQIDEAIVTAIGDYATGNLNNKNLETGIKRLWTKIVELINKVFGKDINPSELSFNSTLNEVANLLLDRRPINEVTNTENNEIQYQKNNTYSEDKFQFTSEHVDEELLPNQEKENIANSKYKEQIVFIKREISRLRDELTKEPETSAKYLVIAQKIQEYSSKIKSISLKNEIYAVKDIGKSMLNGIEGYLDDIINGSPREIKAKDIDYVRRTLDTFIKFPALAYKADKLSEKFTPWLKRYATFEINEYDNSGKPINWDQVQNQTEDINRFQKGVGALADLSNYLARTISSIVKNAQNKITELNKKIGHEINAEIDLLESYVKKSGINKKDMYKPFLQELGGTLVLTNPYTTEYYAELRRNNENLVSNEADIRDKAETWLSKNEHTPEKKYINTNYTKIQNTPELKRFYDFYKGVINDAKRKVPVNFEDDFIANIRKSTMEQVIDGGGVRSVLHGLKESLGNLIHTEDISAKDFIGDEDLFADVVPIKYVQKLDSELKTRDLGYALTKFAHFANSYEELSNVLPETRILQSQIKEIGDTKGYKKSSSETRIKGEDSNLFKMVDDFIEQQVKGNVRDKEGRIKVSTSVNDKGETIDKYVAFSDVADQAIKHNSLLRIGFNPFSAISNAFVGDIGNIIEAFGSRYYSIKDLGKATKIFFAEIFDKESKVNKLLDTIDPLQELGEYETLESSKRLSKVNMDSVKSAAFIGQTIGEKYLQTRTMIATMLHEKVKTKSGSEISLWETFDKNGKWDEKKMGYPLPDKEIRNIRDKIQRVNQLIHGRYSARDAATLQKSVLFRLAFSFRKFIPAAIENRIGKRQYDNRLQTDVEGRWITFFNLFKNYKDTVQRLGDKGWNGLTELEQYNMRKNLAELIMIAASVLSYKALFGGDDDDERRKNPYVKFALNQLNRISGDLLFFYNPSQPVEMLKSALPITKFAEDLIKTVKFIPYAVYWDDEAFYQQGNKSGENKFVSSAGSLVPGLKVYGDLKRLYNAEAFQEFKK